MSQAAASLGLSQPTVSLQVRELESELDAILFDRSGAGIALTRAGECLYDIAEPLVQGMEELSVRKLDRSDDPDSYFRLRIAASAGGGTVTLPAYVKQLREQYPATRLEVKTCPQKEGIRMLLSGEVECAFGAYGSYPEEECEYHEIVSYDIVLITAVDHPLAKRGAVSAREIAPWPAIAPTMGTRSRQFGETAARQFGVETNVVIEVGGWQAIKRYVQCGLGISVIPSIFILPTDRLWVFPLKEYFPTRSYGVYMRRDKALTPPARGLLQLMIPDFAKTTSTSPSASTSSAGGGADSRTTTWARCGLRQDPSAEFGRAPRLRSRAHPCPFRRRESQAVAGAGPSIARPITSCMAWRYALPRGRSRAPPVAAACSAGSNGMMTSGRRSASA